MKRRQFTKTLALGTAGILSPFNRLIAQQADAIKITILYNNIECSCNLESSWGFSAWIEGKEIATLFDTGGDQDILWRNMQKKNINLDKLSNIVISHNHWDHTNGLGLILEKTGYKPHVFVIKKDIEKLKKEYPRAKIKSVLKPKPIADNLWTTGQLTKYFPTDEINEQSIIILKSNKVYLLTGCSHPGIVETVETVKSIFPEKTIELVAGGFHLMRKPKNGVKEISDALKGLGVINLAPSHCTGEKATEIFRNEWGSNFRSLELGAEIEI